MAAKPERSSGQFNYQVSWEGPDGRAVEAGFQEVSGLGSEITVAAYRAGATTENSPRKVGGTYKIPDVTLKRGLINSRDLHAWVDALRQGEPNQRRDVTVKQLAEDGKTAALQWKLIDARPLKFTGPSLSGQGGTDLAIEELVLAVERIDQL